MVSRSNLLGVVIQSKCCKVIDLRCCSKSSRDFFEKVVDNGKTKLAAMIHLLGLFSDSKAKSLGLWFRTE